VLDQELYNFTPRVSDQARLPLYRCQLQEEDDNSVHEDLSEAEPSQNGALLSVDNKHKDSSKLLLNPIKRDKRKPNIPKEHRLPSYFNLGSGGDGHPALLSRQVQVGVQA